MTYTAVDMHGSQALRRTLLPMRSILPAFPEGTPRDEALRTCRTITFRPISDTR